jgi:hypothetical protein
LALIGTKTIRQGKTREGALSQLCQKGGEIYDADRRVPWPGKAAVVIATVAVSRGSSGLKASLDGKPASRINSFLVDADIEVTPDPLRSNGSGCFEGIKISGSGFMFEDDNQDASPIAKMHEVITKNPQSKELIKVYVGGEQVNNQPSFQPERYVIDFAEMSEQDASRHQLLWKIAEEKVKTVRAKNNNERSRSCWWQFARSRPEMRKAISDNPRVLVANCAAAKFLTFAFLPNDCLFSNSLNVFSNPTYAHFAVVQSRVHELWARMFGSSMKDDLRYTGTTCYENYPFPAFSDKLEIAGENYNSERAAVMVKLQLGLTKLSNRLNSPDDHSAEIIRLRELHAAMDKAVLDAYGWSDIVPVYEFSGDYENDDGSAGSVRLNFTEEVRDEILRRLLALHAERLKAEQSAAPIAGKYDTKARKPKKSKDSSDPDLFNL